MPEADCGQVEEEEPEKETLLTYCEVSRELLAIAVQTGLHTYVIQHEHLNTTTLYAPPVRWFLAIQFPGQPGQLSVGRYVDRELGGKLVKNILQGERQIPFADLTRDALEELVIEAFAELVRRELEDLPQFTFLPPQPSTPPRLDKPRH